MEGLLELDRIGKLIAGKYRLELVLGRGGMGTVYRATHTWTGRAVAVKYLHPDHAQDAASVGRFLREARAAASVRHPNAVDVLDMGQDTDGSAYLVLELLEGTTLADQLSASKRLEPVTAARLLVPVLEALEELHRVGVVHRDFKPANIFLAVSPRGHVIPKLLDFGVAKVLDENAGTSTTTGIVVGTPAYMAPEQAAGNGEVGPWTDLWAVGAVLYQCLVGELPFVAATPSLMLVDVMTKNAPKLATRRPDLDPAICDVVDRALTKDIKVRFRSAAQMAEALCKATGLELGMPSAPLQGLVARPAGSQGESPTSTKAPALPSSDTIQLSSDSMMVPTALPEAPTVLATPSGKPRSLPPPPLPLSVPPPPPPPAVSREAASASESGSPFTPGHGKEEKKHWTGPSATGRLQAPGLGRGRTALAIAALSLLGIVGAWRLQGGSAERKDTDPRADVRSSSREDGAAVRAEPSAAPPIMGAAAPRVEVQQPALAEQPDASTAPAPSGASVPSGPATALTREPAATTPPAATSSRPKPTRSSARRELERPNTASTAPTPAAQLPAEKQPDSASPPRVVREW